MNIHSLLKNALGCLILATVPLSFANAVTIDFEAQGTNAPRFLNGNVNSPLTIGIATFTGGEILKNEPIFTDKTAIYATGGILPGAGVGPYSDPLTISFAKPVSGFSLLLTNALPDFYTVTDDEGHKVTKPFLAGSKTFSLADQGITSVSIYGDAPLAYGYAIDNVTFTPAAAVPDTGSTLMLLSIALGGLLLVSRGVRLA